MLKRECLLSPNRGRSLYLFVFKEIVTLFTKQQDSKAKQGAFKGIIKFTKQQDSKAKQGFISFFFNSIMFNVGKGFIIFTLSNVEHRSRQIVESKLR